LTAGICIFGASSFGAAGIFGGAIDTFGIAMPMPIPPPAAAGAASSSAPAGVATGARIIRVYSLSPGGVAGAAGADGATGLRNALVAPSPPEGKLDAGDCGATELGAAS
jgi:hypothetical protein